MVWYPKDDFDAAGYTVPDDVRRAHRPLRPDRGATAARRGASVSSPGRDRLAGDRLDGRPHARDRGAGRLRPVGQPRDPVQRPGRGDRRQAVRRRHVRGWVRARWCRSDAGDRVRRRSRSRCSRTRRAAGSTARRASSTPSSRRTPRRASTTTGSRSPAIDQEGTLFAGELAVVGSGTAPRSWTSSSSSSAKRSSAQMGGEHGVVADLAERQRRAGLLRERDPGRRVRGADRGARGRGPAGFDASDLMPPEVGIGQLLDRDDDVHEGGAGLADRRPRRRSRRAGRR